MNNTIESLSKEKCCGCSACEAVCPKKAIIMSSDEQGFLYPTVDHEECVSCGLCLKVCTAKSVVNAGVVASYAAINRNDDVLKESSSGGVSNAIARYVVANSGVVYGVVYDSEFKVVTQRLDTVESLNRLYGSKYVQTNPKDSFRNVYKDLLGGHLVVYFGTSCHVAGLLAYLREKKVDQSKLITVDLICHGVPSPKLFGDYIAWLNRSGRLVKFDFRTKSKPWGYGSKNYGCRITYRSILGRRHVKKVDTLKARVFLNLFFSNTCLRPYCYDCPYAAVEKPADITIADFWGCKEEEPDAFTEKGVSAVLAHTEKGKKLIETLPDLEWKETTIDKIAKKQAMTKASTPKSTSYDRFWSDYYANGFKYIASKYGKYNAKEWLRKTGAYRLLVKIIKKR